MSIILTKSNYNEVVKESNLPVLIDFYADWCGPCKMAAPIVEQIAGELKDQAKVCKVNVDYESELAGAFGIVSIPTFVILKNNKIINRISGLRSKQELIKLITSA